RCSPCLSRPRIGTRGFQRGFLGFADSAERMVYATEHVSRDRDAKEAPARSAAGAATQVGSKVWTPRGTTLLTELRPRRSQGRSWGGKKAPGGVGRSTGAVTGGQGGA